MLPNLTVWETLMFVSHFTLNEDEACKEERVRYLTEDIFHDFHILLKMISY